MRKAFLLTFTIAFSTLAIVSYSRLKKLAFPRTFLGKKNVSYEKKEQIAAWLTDSYRKPVLLKIRNRIYRIDLKHLGVLLDGQSTLRAVYEPNAKPFPQDISSFARSLRSQRMLLPGLVFSQDFTAYLEKSRFDFTENRDEVKVDNNAKRLELTDNEEIYRIDGEHLKSLILFHYGESGPTLEPRLIRVVKEQKQEDIDKENRLIDQVFSTPVDVMLQEGDSLVKTSLSPAELRSVFDVVYEGGSVRFQAKDRELGFLLDAKIDPLVKRGSQTDMKKLKEDVAAAFESRAQGSSGGPLVAQVRRTEPTRTHGEIASRYIEIDVPDQKMYLFDQGQVVKSYTVSTGLYYPTPTGHFHIMNKAPEGYSDIFNVYMPWWMAFHYGWAGDQDAYFGIHELPYWWAGAEKKQRPREFLGSPHTGGCVSLDIGAAKEVYDFSYVGMDVVIF